MSLRLKRSSLSSAVCLSVLLTGAAVSPAQPTPVQSRQFPPGAFQRIEDLPPGRFRLQLEQLPPTARQRATEWLRGIHFTDQDVDSLHVDGSGGVFYVDEFLTDPVSAPAETPVTAAAAVPVSPFPAALIFHSRPGAPNVIYLNFCGEEVSGTAWNTSLNRSVIPAVAFSTDADYSTFSDAEQAAIKRIWQRVAEDFAPFDVDVTTERPVTFGSRTAHALITRSTDANGSANPSSTAGGVAYVNVFGGSSYATYRPAWVYFNNLASSESYIAEATSHEVGHNLGLTHDGKTDGTTYYAGHGSGDTSWGPIMGTGYNRNVSQWSKGEYYLANNTQDDLAILAGKLSYRSDDHGNTRTLATPLVLTGGTNVISTTPENDPDNFNPANKGVLDQNTDVDVFSFVTGNGQVLLSVKPWITAAGTRGGNLDIVLELYNSAGVRLLTNNPASQTLATIQTTLTEGQYFLYVRNTGVGSPFSSSPSGYTAYASIGQYFISGYVRPSGYVAPPQAELQVADLTQAGTSQVQFTLTYTDDLAVDVSTLDDGDVRVTGPGGYDRAAQLLSVDLATHGTPRAATYSIAPPAGGFWTDSHNGDYTVWLQPDEVCDTSGACAPGQALGHFLIDLPTLVYFDNLDADPGWSLQAQWQYGTPAYGSSGPSAGFTGTRIIGYNLSGNYGNNMATAYATTPAINCSAAASLTLQFRRWLRLRNGDTALIQVSTNGANWTTIWSTTQSVSDTAWQLMQYALPAWTGGSPSVRLRWGIGSGPSQNDLGWNIDDLQIVGTGGPGAPVVEYELVAAANDPAWGTVNPSGGVYPAGTAVQVVARPAQYFQFANWSGDATGTNNPITVQVNSNLALVAVFREMLTTNHPTPLWWLASYGFLQNFENVVLSLGSNGMPVWQSYVAGLNPNDPASRLELAVAPLEDAQIKLYWNTVTGRVYTVWSSPDPAQGFAPLVGASNLPASITGFTNTIGASSPGMFYRLEVRKP